MLILKKNHNAEQTKEFLIDNYDELNWGETLDQFIIENFELIKNHKGCLIHIMNEKEIIGGFILYEHENKKFIGCATIFKIYRKNNYFKQILDFLNEEYRQFYLFCQENLFDYYQRFLYLTHKEIYINEKKIYLFSNSNDFNFKKIVIF